MAEGSSAGSNDELVDDSLLGNGQRFPVGSLFPIRYPNLFVEYGHFHRFCAPEMLLARDSDDTGNQVLLRVLGSRWARRTSSVWQANLNKFIGMFYRRISERRKMNRKENRDS